VIIVAYFILFPSPLKKLANHQPAEHQAAVRVFLLLLLTRRQSRVCVFLVRGVVVVVVDVEDVVECVCIFGREHDSLLLLLESSG
jgi:hypothetical protein